MARHKSAAHASYHSLSVCNLSGLDVSGCCTLDIIKRCDWIFAVIFGSHINLCFEPVWAFISKCSGSSFYSWHFAI